MNISHIIVILAIYTILIFAVIEIANAIRNKLFQYLEKKVIKKIKEKYELIPEISSGYPYNNQNCHKVAKYFAETKKLGISAVYAIDKERDFVVAHFINYKDRDKIRTYTDNTYGHSSDFYDYYLVNNYDHTVDIKTLSESLTKYKKGTFLLGNSLWTRVLIKLADYSL